MLTGCEKRETQARFLLTRVRRRFLTFPYRVRPFSIFPTGFEVSFLCRQDAAVSGCRYGLCGLSQAWHGTWPGQARFEPQSRHGPRFYSFLVRMIDLFKKGGKFSLDVVLISRVLGESTLVCSAWLLRLN